MYIHTSAFYWNIFTTSTLIIKLLQPKLCSRWTYASHNGNARVDLTIFMEILLLLSRRAMTLACENSNQTLVDLIYYRISSFYQKNSMAYWVFSLLVLQFPIEGCQCEPGYVRHNNGDCVPQSECGKYGNEDNYDPKVDNPSVQRPQCKRSEKFGRITTREPTCERPLMFLIKSVSIFNIL